MGARDPLRVPLDAEAEALPCPLDRLDHTVRSAGRYTQSLAGPRDGLVMRAVHGLRLAADRRLEKRPRFHLDRVASFAFREQVLEGVRNVEWNVVEQ
jgi:hypothetical protein